MGLLLGVFLSVVVHLRGASRPDVERLLGEQKTAYLQPGMEAKESTVVMISGELFFGSSQSLSQTLAQLRASDGGQAHLIIVGDYLQDIDSTAAELLVQEARRRSAAGFQTRLRLRSNVLARSRGGDILRQGLGAEVLLAIDPIPLER